MSLPILANATDIARWADRRSAQGTLPRLVRRLVFATAASPLEVRFAADEGVQLAGWDGIVVATESAPFVPAGASGWEIGTSADPRAKANSDFATRTADPGGEIDPARATFVFVTPRQWPRKAVWETEKRGEGKWLAVRAFDAHDLESWLEQAPAVHLWLSSLLGVRPDGVDDIETSWRDWADGTEPALTPSVTIAGREETANAVVTWLRGTEPILNLQGSSRQEAEAFVAAVIQRMPEEERDRIAARVVVVRDASAWNHLAASQPPLLLIAAFEVGSLLSRALRGGHRVIVPLEPSAAISTTTHVLPRASRSALESSLLEMSVGERRARDLASIGRRSMLSLRRRMAISAPAQSPAWSRADHAGTAIALLMAGAWQENVDGDREVFAKLARLPIEVALGETAALAAASDPPVRRVGTVWYLVSREDAWSLLINRLTRDDLNNVVEVAVDVLSTPDPQYELPAEQRYAASIFGKKARHSVWLRRGLAESLALLAASAGTTPTGVAESLEAVASRAVRAVLAGADRDWMRLASLADVMPLLAEAAPEVFLDAMAAALEGEDPPLLKLFVDGGGSWNTSSPHPHLLWALETLAWSSQHFARAVLVLATLAAREPGGKIVNRPINSLQQIFLGWQPQTTADLDRRLQVLDIMREREPEVAWALMSSLLPSGPGATSHPTPRPKWRDWIVGEESSDVPADYGRGIDEIVQRMLCDAGLQGQRWVTLIKALANLPREPWERIVEALDRMDATRLADPDRQVIWAAIRDFAGQHRSFPEARWALPEEFVARVAALYDRFEPHASFAKHMWLFHPGAMPIDGRPGDYGQRADAIEALRQDATRRLVADGGYAELIRFAASAERPELVGHAAGGYDHESSPDAESTLIRETLESLDPKVNAFGAGFAHSVMQRRGRAWAERVAAEATGAWKPQALAQFLCLLPADRQTWAVVGSVGGEVLELYWQRFPPYVIAAADASDAAERFLAHGRPLAGIEAIYLHVREPAVPPALLCELLERAASDIAAAPEEVGSVYHEVGEVLEVLGAAAEADGELAARVGQIEMTYLPLFGPHGRRPIVLHREMRERPDLFVAAICHAFKPDPPEPEARDEDHAFIARLSYELLDGWHEIPGAASGVSVDHLKLTAWIDRARGALAEKGRQRMGDVYIGKLLSASPFDPDGSWPHSAVRDQIERLASNEIDQGFDSGVFNSRGVTTRSLTEGGLQERNLADRYEGFAKRADLKWPRTAALLRHLAQTYRDQARREDASAELRQDMD